MGWSVRALAPQIVQHLGSGLDARNFEYKVSGKKLKFRIGALGSNGIWSGAWGWLVPSWDRDRLMLDGDWSTGEYPDPKGPKL